MADEPKPSYVRFEIRDQEDRDASIAAGHYVGKDVIFAIVTAPGGKDSIEREAEAWLDNVREGVKQERIPMLWLQHYEMMLKNFKESRDSPETGYPIADWPALSKGQVKLMLDINIRTVEELAAANEETINRIGMGARALKQKAVAWLEAADGPGKLAEETNALRIQVEALLKRDEEREAELTKLKAQLAALSPEKEEA